MYKFITMVDSVAHLITMSPISYLPFDLHPDLRCYVFSVVAFLKISLLLATAAAAFSDLAKLNNLSLFLADLAFNFYQAFISDCLMTKLSPFAHCSYLHVPSCSRA